MILTSAFLVGFQATLKEDGSQKCEYSTPVETGWEVKGQLDMDCISGYTASMNITGSGHDRSIVVAYDQQSGAISFDTKHTYNDSKLHFQDNHWDPSPKDWRMGSLEFFFP